MSIIEPEDFDASQIEDLFSDHEHLANSGESAIPEERGQQPRHSEDEELRHCVDLLEQLRVTQYQDSVTPSQKLEQFPSVHGHRIGRYVLKEFVGRGAFGVVYRALDEELNRDVALKLPRQEVLFDHEKLQRFQQEATAAASLDHPWIVSVLDANLHGAMPYIAAAFCEGPDLEEWLTQQQHPVPATEAARFVAQLANAVEHAHQSGILHRDLKPSNVLLAATNSPIIEGTPTDSKQLSSYEPRLTDFGLAKLIEASLEDTRSSLLVGTPLYMAPEQMGVGRSNADAQTDVYALGVLLYELLTLQTPFDGASYIEVVDRVRSDEPTPISKVNDQVPRDLAVICEKCIRKEPEHRYATAQALSEDLRRFLARQPIRARSQTTWERFSRWCTKPDRIEQSVLLVTVFQLLMIGWVSLGYATLGQVLAGAELLADRIHLLFAVFGVHVPMATATWLGARYDHRYFYAALFFTTFGHMLMPLLGMCESIGFIKASYSRQEYFLFTNFGLVFLAGLIQAFSLTTALLASRRRQQLQCS